MNRSLVVTIVIIAVALVGGGLLIIRDSNNPPTSPAQNQTTETPSTTSPSEGNAAIFITYNGSGFSPAKLIVKSGDNVTFRNNSSTDVEPSSNPHPTHTDNPELNIGVISAGKNRTVILTKTGTWGYHNHLSTSEKGTIVVQ